MRGLFVAFEGGDGSGKTSLMARMAFALQNGGRDVLTTREPGGTLLGDSLRQILLQSHATLTPKAELALFLAARAEHVQTVIEPALAKGQVVLCDRFHASTVAYQGAGRELGTRKVRELSLWFASGLVPDLTYYLDVSLEEAFSRLRRRQGASDRIERESWEYHKRVREGFLSEAEEEKYVVVNAALSQEEVFDAAWREWQRRGL